MMSLWSRLFGGGVPKAEAPEAPAAEIEHNGFTIRSEPYKVEGGQFQTAGTVLKVVGGEAKEHRFVRADRFASRDEAAEFALRKGRQIVDEQGERLFG